MIEVWKDIPGYEGIYKASSLGRIKSLSRVNVSGRRKFFNERVLVPVKHGNGYYSVQLCKDLKPKRYLVHRLVALAFLDNPLNLDSVDHIDHNKKNNTVDNLRWISNLNNQRHSAWKRIGLLNKTSSVVVHSEYGVFCSVGEAAKVSSKHPSTMSMMLSGKIPNTTKFIRV